MDLSTKNGRREQGQRVQKAVERAGISIEELAGRIGCSRALIYQYLAGTTLAQPDRLQQIAAECAVPLTYFYSDEDAISSSPSPESQKAEAVASGSAATTASQAAAVIPITPAPAEVAIRLNDSLLALQELAAAQEGPPDYRSLASTCERILSLVAQTNDRAAQARAQRRLGNALINIGDYPRAADALSRAVSLAVAASDAESETSARQSLGKAYLLMGRTDEARSEFIRIADGTILDGRWKGLLSLGSIHERQGEYREAMERFDEASSLLEEAEAQGLSNAGETAIGLLYVNANRRNVYLAGGDLGEARRLAEKCLLDAESLGNADQNLEARLDLAWCDLYTGRWTQAFHGLTAMLQLARFVGDQGRETMARIALGILLAAAGDFDSAIANGKDALATALSRGDRRAELYAQLALADAYTGAAGRAAEARYHTTQALAITASGRYARAEIEGRLRLSRLNALSGDIQSEQEAAERALTVSESLGARHLESLAHVWRADALLHSISLRSEGDAEGNQEGAAESAKQSTASKAETLAENGERISALATAQREAEVGLALAEETDFNESRWRGLTALAQILLASGDVGGAETRSREAVAVLESLRAALVGAGLPDTLLENDDAVIVYAFLARLLDRTSRTDESDAFLEQTGWPPLTSRLIAERASEQSLSDGRV